MSSARHGDGDSSAIPVSVWVAVAVGMLAFGIAPILVRLGSDAAGVTLAAGRMVIATLVLLPFAWKHTRKEIGQLSGGEWGMLTAGGILLGLHFIGWTESLYHTSVASASVLVTTSPIFIALLGFFLFRERLTRRTVTAIMVGVAGAVLIGLSDSDDGAFPTAAIGNSLALAAAAFVALYLLIGSRLRRKLGLMAYLLPLYGIAAVTTVIAMVFAGEGLPQSNTAWLVCVLLAVGPQLMGHSAFNYAIGYIPAAHVGLMTLAEPVLATMAALILFSEVPPPIAIAGMVLVLSAIGVIVRRRTRPVAVIPPT
jgi:drug/metabolite transporter (DMT)-like permease